MLSIFRSNQVLLGFLFLPLLVLFYGAMLLHFADAPLLDDSTWGWLKEIQASRKGLWLGLVIVFVHSFLINEVVVKNRLHTNSFLFPGLMYLILVCFIQETIGLSSILLANTFVLMALRSVMMSEKKYTNAIPVFNSGIFIGIASFFYFPYILLVFWVFFSLQKLRGVNILDVIRVVLGVMVLYWLLAVYLYVTDNLSMLWGSLSKKDFGVIGWAGGTSLYSTIGIGFILLVSIYVLLISNSYVRKKVINIQRKVEVVRLLGLFMAFLILLLGDVSGSQILILSIPISIFLGFFISNKSSTVADMYLLVLVIWLVINQYHPVIIGA